MKELKKKFKNKLKEAMQKRYERVPMDKKLEDFKVNFIKIIPKNRIIAII